MAETLLSTGFRFDKLPENYIRPESERPRLSEVVSLKVPLIDLDSSIINRDEIVSQIGNACRDFGIFQVTNHGISTESIQKVFTVTKEFFQLPVEEKMRYYSNDPSKKVRLSTSRYFNVENEKVHNWRDFLRFYSNPLEEFVNDWPTNPQSFKDVMGKYSRESRELGFKLLGAISESLGLETD
ncbi:hypothetical protein AAC387_Pa06g0410 [Persea americana]